MFTKSLTVRFFPLVISKTSNGCVASDLITDGALELEGDPFPCALVLAEAGTSEAGGDDNSGTEDDPSVAAAVS